MKMKLNSANPRLGTFRGVIPQRNLYKNSNPEVFPLGHRVLTSKDTNIQSKVAEKKKKTTTKQNKT